MKPRYYKSKSEFDVIDIAKEYDLNFNRGNILKYICRAGKKDNEIEDLTKAQEYLERELTYLKTVIVDE